MFIIFYICVQVNIVTYYVKERRVVRKA